MSTSTDPLENSILNPQSQPRSPARSRSSSASSRSSSSSHQPQPHTQSQPTFSGPTSGPQTGVKGILNDASHHRSQTAQLQRLAISERNRQLEGRAIVGQTWEEEERSRKAERDAEEEGLDDDDEEEVKRWRSNRLSQLKAQSHPNPSSLSLASSQPPFSSYAPAPLLTSSHSTNQGHQNTYPYQDNVEVGERYQPYKRPGLREVDAKGFLGVVEGEGWVLVMLYEPDLPRCKPLLSALHSLQNKSLSTSKDNTTSGLAVKGKKSFYKARATLLSFSLLSASSGDAGRGGREGNRIGGRIREEDEDEDDGEYNDDYDLYPSDYEGGASTSAPRSDLDVLPTLLAYHNGELHESFVRVDMMLDVPLPLEAAGVGELVEIEGSGRGGEAGGEVEGALRRVLIRYVSGLKRFEGRDGLRLYADGLAGCRCYESSSWALRIGMAYPSSHVQALG